MATKAWKGAIREPSSWANNKCKIPTGPPSAVLEMHHVYGYRSQDVRSNLWYTSGVSEFVYHSAAVGIVYNSTTHKQRYNLTHGRHIISLAAYPKAALVATGRRGTSLWQGGFGSLSLRQCLGVNTQSALIEQDSLLSCALT
jgi:hypothetical protein